MLKRVVRHRMFVAFVIILLGVAMLGAPLRRDYSIPYQQPVCMHAGAVCQGPAPTQTTEIQYGAPWGWLTLGKQQDESGKTLRNYTSKDTTNLLYDIVSFGLITAIGLLLTQKTRNTL